jgi:hypothetical protein
VIAAVSALDVALVGAIAATSGAIVSPLTGWLVASATHRHERWLQLYEDRRDAYTSVLKTTWEQRYTVRELIRIIEEQAPGSMSLPPLASPAELGETWARIAAFASPRVLAAVEAFQNEFQTLAEEMDGLDMNSADNHPEGLRRLRAVNARLDERARNVRSLVHEELAR